MHVLGMTAMMAAGETTGSAGATAHAASLALWQAQDAMTSSHIFWLQVFVGLVAVAMVVQAVVVVIAAVGAMKSQKAIMGHVLEVKAKVMPLVEKSHALVTDLTPEIKLIATKVHDITEKVDLITGHIEEITGVAKEKAKEFAPTISAVNVTFGEANDTARETNQKVRAQVTRVNGMISSTLDATAKIGKAIERGISIPGREIAGIVSGAKATIDSLLKSAKAAGAKPVGRTPAGAYRASSPVSPSARPESAGSGFPVSAGIPARPAPAGGTAEAAAAAASAAFEGVEKRDLGL